SELITPVPTAQQLVCPGGVLRLSDETGQGATTASSLGSPRTDYAADRGAVDAAAFTASDAGTAGGADAPTLVSTPPSDDGETAPPMLSGAQVQAVDEGDFVGLAAADCAVPTGDIWLVGGSTTVGRTTLLTLANPSEVPATVDLELFGDFGPIAAPGTRGIVVAPGGQRVLSLAGFQPDLAAPVVHVTSTGGQVVANLQQSIVRGLQPGGVDILSGSSVGTELVIPGLVIAPTEPVLALQGRGEGYADLAPALRLFAPGEADVPVTISVIPEDGAQTGTSFELELSGSRVTDVPIDSLAAGSYTVQVDAGSPIVAAARSSSAAGELSDLAWAAAAPVLQDRAQVTVADGPNPRLHLANPGEDELVVTVGDQSVTVGAGTAVQVPVDAGRTYQLTADGALMAAVTLGQDAQLAHYPVHPPGAASAPIRVYR
ncbi:MAG TPA: DUF5719 family protein, partial [Rhodoglobus sp.]|nr:DUF5719 family protein [Rhodoglobus sp.]